MTELDIPVRRLANQLIADDNKPGMPDQVVRRMGAIQAQSYTQALWAVGLRTQKPSLKEVEQSIDEGKIVLTWAMRGTIHMVPAEDAGWMLKLLSPRVLAGDRRRREQLELTEDTIERCGRIIYDALSGNKRLTRAALMALLEDSGVRTNDQRGYHLLWHLAQTGLICQGPKEGGQQTFVLLDEWAQGSKQLSNEESLALLAERYFTSHGPATAHDFAWWAGMTLTDARRGIAAARSALASHQAEGMEYWTGTDRQGEQAEPLSGSGVHLLPGFDEYLLGYKDRSSVLRTEHARSIVPGGNGIFLPMIVIDGRISGIWKPNVKKRGAEIEVRLFERHKHGKEAIAEAAARYCSFLELPMSSLDIQVEA